jgi:hypothetical protein
MQCPQSLWYPLNHPLCPTPLPSQSPFSLKYKENIAIGGGGGWNLEGRFDILVT